jgi:hypothetical protein
MPEKVIATDYCGCKTVVHWDDFCPETTGIERCKKHEVEYEKSMQPLWDKDDLKCLQVQVKMKQQALRTARNELAEFKKKLKEKNE